MPKLLFQGSITAFPVFLFEITHKLMMDYSWPAWWNSTGTERRVSKEFFILLWNYQSYYPQANKMVERADDLLISYFTLHASGWDKRLPSVLYEIDKWQGPWYNEDFCNAGFLSRAVFDNEGWLGKGYSHSITAHSSYSLPGLSFRSLHLEVWPE